MDKLTYFACTVMEEALAMEVSGRCLAEQNAQIEAHDLQERMGGRCDLCQEPSEHGMTLDGGLALCDGCLDV